MAPCPLASFAIPQTIRNLESVSDTSNRTRRSNIRLSTNDLLSMSKVARRSRYRSRPCQPAKLVRRTSHGID